MTAIGFGSSWHWANNAADIIAHAISGDNVSSVLAAEEDPAGAGGRTLVTGTGSGPVYFPVLEHPTEWTLHFWCYQNSGSSGAGTTALRLTDVGASTGFFRLTTGPNEFSVVLKGSTIGTFPDGSLTVPGHYMIHVLEHASAGFLRAYLDGELVFGAEDLNSARTLTIDRMGLAGLASNRAAQLAHVIFAGGPPLGRNAVVTYHPPTSDVAPNEFTRSDGGLAHYEHLDDQPHDGDSTYLLSPDTGVGNRTRHRHTVSLPGRRIIGARASAVARLEDVSGDRIGVKYESGAAAAVDHVLEQFGADYTFRGGLWLSEDPDTSQEWTEAGLSDLEVELQHLAPEA